MIFKEIVVSREVCFDLFSAFCGFLVAFLDLGVAAFTA